VTAGVVYVYGVVAAADAASISHTGVEGSPVRTVSEGDLAALVSDVAGGALAAAREVRAHWRVLEAVSAQATVLPVRFGTVMEDDDAIRTQLLAANGERLSALLKELAGRVQVAVKGNYRQDELLRGVVAASPTVAALRKRIESLPEDAGYYERIRLGELVAAEVERRREDDAARALARLEPLAVATRSEGVGTPDAAFNLAFLVERERLDEFSAAVTALIDELGDRVAVRYVGPLAPYSFADAELVTEAV
jgi:Gas vesicle synthesis protein GvpL/GvpF